MDVKQQVAGPRGAQPQRLGCGPISLRAALLNRKITANILGI